MYLHKILIIKKKRKINTLFVKLTTFYLEKKGKKKKLFWFQKFVKNNNKNKIFIIFI